MINCCLAGRILFPERPICTCVHLLLTRISETARCAVFLYLSKGPDHCGGLPLWNPNPPLLHAHRLVTLKPVNLFSALYCSKPLPVPAIRARYVCWAAKPRFCHFERAWESLVRAIRVQNLRAWYNPRRHRGVWGRGSRNPPALLLLLASKVSPSGRTRQQEIFWQQPMRLYIGTAAQNRALGE